MVASNDAVRICSLKESSFKGVSQSCCEKCPYKMSGWPDAAYTVEPVVSRCTGKILHHCLGLVVFPFFTTFRNNCFSQVMLDICDFPAIQGN